MVDRKLFFSISTVLLLTYFDLHRSYFTRTDSDSPSPSSLSTADNLSSSIPIPKIKNHRQLSPVIKFRYCLSSGYENLFKQFSQLVQTHYPNMAVIGENYSPGRFRASFAKALSLIKILLLICILFNQNPFRLVNLSTPMIYSLALENKLYACFMIFFASSSIESYLISTGAFEIAVDDVPLWSKLHTGRIPSANEFVQMLQPFGTSSNLK